MNAHRPAKAVRDASALRGLRTPGDVPFQIRELRPIERGKLRCGFILDIGGASIECELFQNERGVWIDARSVKDARGEYRRTVRLDRTLRDCVAAKVLALYQAPNEPIPAPDESEKVS